LRHAADVEEIVGGREWAARLANRDDALGKCGADTGQRLEFACIGAIQIDDLPRRVAFRIGLGGAAGGNGRTGVTGVAFTRRFSLTAASGPLRLPDRHAGNRAPRATRRRGKRRVLRHDGNFVTVGERGGEVERDEIGIGASAPAARRASAARLRRDSV